MKIIPKDALRREIIGETIKVVSSTNKDLVGIKGKVIDETRNMFIIKSKKMKKILKNQVVIELKGMQIDGNLLIGKAEDRLKKWKSKM